MFEMNDDEAREFARALFAPTPVPADLVPRSEPTQEERREHLLSLNRAADSERMMTTPGEVLEDVDGNPIGMTAPTTELVFIGAATITPDDLERAGLTEEDVPNLNITDFTKEK